MFVRGATEAINLVAQSWGPASLKAGDEIVISDVEHHSNIVPWQHAARPARRSKLVVAPTDDTGEFDLARFRGAAVAAHPARRDDACLERDRRDVAGRDASPRWRIAHGAKVLIDGCQAVPRHAGRCARARLRFLRLFRPQGLRADRDRRAVRRATTLLEAMPPWQTGGGMILNVEIDHTDFQDPPHRFEAGTPDIAGAVGLGARDRLHREDRPRRRSASTRRR